MAPFAVDPPSPLTMILQRPPWWPRCVRWAPRAPRGWEGPALGGCVGLGARAGVHLECRSSTRLERRGDVRCPCRALLWGLVAYACPMGSTRPEVPSGTRTAGWGAAIRAEQQCSARAKRACDP